MTPCVQKVLLPDSNKSHISFPSVSTVKCKHLDSKELEVKDFEDAIEQMLRDTEEKDLDKLITNFIQSRSPLNMTEGHESWAFAMESAMEAL